MILALACISPYATAMPCTGAVETAAVVNLLARRSRFRSRDWIGMPGSRDRWTRNTPNSTVPVGTPQHDELGRRIESVRTSASMSGDRQWPASCISTSSATVAANDWGFADVEGSVRRSAPRGRPGAIDAGWRGGWRAPTNKGGASAGRVGHGVADQDGQCLLVDVVVAEGAGHRASAIPCPAGARTAPLTNQRLSCGTEHPLTLSARNDPCTPPTSGPLPGPPCRGMHHCTLVGARDSALHRHVLHKARSSSSGCNPPWQPGHVRIGSGGFRHPIDRLRRSFWSASRISSL